MSDEIVFYTNPMSRGRIIRWMLEEVGRPYRTVVLDWATNANKSPEYLAVNPMGKVPAIVHGDTVVTECAAICAYLADVFAETKLAPPHGSRLRGPYYRWLFFGAGCFEPALLDEMMKRPPPPRKAAVGWGDYNDVVTTLKTALAKGPYLLGEAFSAADVYLGSEIRWAMMFGAPGLKGEKVFDDYAARLAARPALQRTMGAKQAG